MRHKGCWSSHPVNLSFSSISETFVTGAYVRIHKEMPGQKDKKTLSARVPHDIEVRVQEYRERCGINQTDAMRRLLKEGLDSIDEERRRTEGGARESPRDVEMSRTSTEQWCEDRFRTWLSGMLLSGSVTLALWIAFGAVELFPGIDPVQWLPTQLISIVIFVGIVLFLTFGAGSLVTGVFLKTGYAAKFDFWRNDSAEQDVGAT